jgi:hypothetical protein
VPKVRTIRWRPLLAVVFALAIGLPWVLGEYAVQVILDGEASASTYLTKRRRSA